MNSLKRILNRSSTRDRFWRHSTRRLEQPYNLTVTRGKRTAGALDAALKGKKVPVNSAQSSGEDAAKRLLSRHDLNTPPPIIPSPPPPPPRRGIRRYILPTSLLFSAAIAAFVLTLEDDEDENFWKDVETGRILLDDDEDDDE